MPSPVNSHRFGLYPSLGNRGRLPVDPAKSGGTIKYIGTFNLNTGTINGITQGIEVGPPKPNKLLVMIPTGFINDTSSIEYFKINDLNAIVFDTTDNTGGQSVISGICCIPFKGYQKTVKVEFKYSVPGPSTPTNHYVSVYNVFPNDPRPVLARKVYSVAEFAKLPIGKGSKGIFCSGSGQPISFRSLENGVIDFQNLSTGRITNVGRIINTARPLIMEGSDTDGFSLAAAYWN